MSEFLDKASGPVEEAVLRMWVRVSIGEMDKLLNEGFPQFFGTMSNFPTAARAELLAGLFDIALGKMAWCMKVDYRANNKAVVGHHHFDCLIFSHEVGDKLSPGKSDLSFAAMSSRKTDNQNPRVLAVKVRIDNHKITAVFAAIVDLSAARDNNTKWHHDGKSGFSALRIANADAGIIVPLCGNIHPKQKYIGTEYETYQSQVYATPRYYCF